MEVDPVSVASVGLGIAFVIILLRRALNWVWLGPKRTERFLREQGLKGNSYKFLFGDFREWSKMSQKALSKPISINDDIVPRVIPFPNELVKTYGKNSFVWFGPKPAVLIMNPESIKEIFNKVYDFSRPTNISPLAKYLATGLLVLEDEKWAKHRKIVNPAFTVGQLKLVLPELHQCCDRVIKKWKSLVTEKGSCEVDVWPVFSSLTGDAISCTAFGSSYEEGSRVFQLLREQSEYTAKVIRSLYVPGWRFAPTKMHKRMKQIEYEIQNILRRIIQKQEKAMKAGEARDDNLLGLLLESNQREIKDHGNNKNAGMSTADVVNECKLFYFAGQESTSTLLNWTVVLLSKFPNWQTKAREEVMEVFGSKKPDYDGLNRLKVVSMILYESLRLYPPVPLLSRFVRKETRVGNLTLPAGTQLVIPCMLIHQDADLWGDDAKEFKPERFSEGVSKATKGRVSYIPFGWGPKICIGQNFALLEAKMALCMILQNFSFELSPTYTHAPRMILSLQPQYGTHVILHKL